MDGITLGTRHSKALPRILLGFLSLGLLVCSLAPTAMAQSHQPWIVYYSDQAPASDFAPYRLLVFDSQFHPPLRAFLDQDKLILGYLSLGEVENHRRHFKEVKAQGLLLEENDNWKGSFFVDVRSPLWTKRVVEELIPDLLLQGFQGIFLDTLDNPGHLERTNPKKYKGMRLAGAKLVQAIRYHYPRLPIMLNRGYDLLPEVGSSIDMLLGEGVYGGYDFEKKTYRAVDPAESAEQVQILTQAKKSNPKLEVFTLDYWNPKDLSGVKQLYQKQRDHGFFPYVSVIQLNQILPEPP